MDPSIPDHPDVATEPAEARSCGQCGRGAADAPSAGSVRDTREFTYSGDGRDAERCRCMEGDDSEPEPLVYAGFVPRLLAFVIDSQLVLLLTIVLFFGIGVLFGIGLDVLTDIMEGAADTISIAVAIILAVTIMLSSAIYCVTGWVRWGRTVGMKVTGIRVIGADGGNLTRGRAFARWFAGYLLPLVVPHLAAIAYLVISVMIVTRKQKQGFHDMLAGSRVVVDPD